VRFSERRASRRLEAGVAAARMVVLHGQLEITNCDLKIGMSCFWAENRRNQPILRSQIVISRWIHPAVRGLQPAGFLARAAGKMPA
jgi:hypothetical protein